MGKRTGTLPQNTRKGVEFHPLLTLGSIAAVAAPFHLDPNWTTLCMATGNIAGLIYCLRNVKDGKTPPEPIHVEGQKKPQPHDNIDLCLQWIQQLDTALDRCFDEGNTVIPGEDQETLVCLQDFPTEGEKLTMRFKGEASSQFLRSYQAHAPYPAPVKNEEPLNITKPEKELSALPI